MSYRSPADGFRTCYRCGADLAEGASFCPNCGATQRLRVRRQAQRRPQWLPFAVVGAGIAAIAVGALLAVLLGDRPDGVAEDPSASASASVEASPAVTPAESGEATPTPSPTPETAALIPNLAIAAVTTDGLNLRSGPSDSAEVIGDLERDRRLFVIGEPDEEDELRWYRVATLPEEMIGYVATPIELGDPWIEQVDIDCPTSPMTAARLGALRPLEALHCFGNNEIVVTGTIVTPSEGYNGPFVWNPDWFGPHIPVFIDAGAGSSVQFHPHPDADLEPPSAGEIVRVTGHYEDPAATSCTIDTDPHYTGEPPSPAVVVLGCRATFVWTEYEVTGHE